MTETAVRDTSLKNGPDLSRYSATAGKDRMVEADTEEQKEGKVLERFTDSQPILDMLDLLSRAGRKNFHDQGAWEICLCALILKMEPNCKVQRILEALPYRKEEMDEADVLNTMAHLGYYCRTAESDLNDIDSRLLPGLFIPGSKAGSNKPCIILGQDGEGNLQFFDPVSRLVSHVPSSFDRGGTVWFFQKYDENRQPTSKFMRKGSGHSWFHALLTRFRGTFAQILTAGLILNIIALATPLFIMLVYDRVIAAGSIETLPMIAVGAFVAIAFEWKLRAIRSSGLSWLAGRLDNIVGNKIFSHLVGLSPDLVERASVAAQIARIKTFESVRDFFSGSVFLSLLETPFVFLYIFAIAMIAGNLVLVPVFMVFGYIALFILIRHKVKVAIRLAAKASSARQQFTIETFEKLEGIRGHGLGKKWEEKFRHLSGREMATHFDLGWLGLIGETLAHALTVISAVATVGYGTHMIWAGDMSTGALVATMILVWRVLTPFYSLCTMIPRLEQLRNSVIQVNDLMEIETEAEEAKSFSRLPKLKGAVSFHNVSFRYSEGTDEIFNNLSFDARPGDLLALAGSNGTGKATILKLVKSLHRASGGTVRIDGFDIRQLDAPYLRRQIAYVPRHPHFFNGSVIENMRISNPMASEETVQKALELADAWEDIQKMPCGLETIIGSHGVVKLSSSLTGRLSLARAYLHPASILLIDDLPNALLSGKAGKNLKDYLVRAKGRRTVIFCTHREDFMRLADTIVWLRSFSSPMAGPRDTMLSVLQSGGGQHMIKNRPLKSVSKKRERQMRYLSQAIQLEEAVNPHIVRATMNMVSLAILAFLCWAGLTNINEVARAPGEVVPQGYQQTVQHLEGGIVKNIHVREGEVVQQGQILVTMSDASIREDMERAQNKQLVLDMQAERLRAFTEKREPDFSRFENADTIMVSDQTSFFEDMRLAREKETRVIQDQIQQKRQHLESLRVDLQTVQSGLGITEDMYRRRKTLNAKGYASDMQLLQDQKEMNHLQGEIKRLKNQILVARTEIAEFEGRLASLSASQQDEINERLDRILAEKSQNVEVIDKLQERINRMQIRAPSHGLVKGMIVNTAGAIIQPGQTLMEIVPLDKELEVQVKISPKDIGHLGAGQAVQLKFSSFDFSRYGSVKGTLDQISATTFANDSGERYYQGRILLSQNHVGHNTDNRIMPGMTVMADVITGEKTILQYLLKPIHVSLKTAFSER